MSKSPRKRSPVIDAVRLSEDKADYLVSTEREQTEETITFEEFLKAHPRDVETFLKGHGRLPGQHVENRTDQIRVRRTTR
jgi:hypothetical protein